MVNQYGVYLYFSNTIISALLWSVEIIWLLLHVCSLILCHGWILPWGICFTMCIVWHLRYLLSPASWLCLFGHIGDQGVIFTCTLSCWYHFLNYTPYPGTNYYQRTRSFSLGSTLFLPNIWLFIVPIFLPWLSCR